MTWNDYLLWLLYQPTETHQAFFLRIRYSRIASCTEFFKNIDPKILWLNKVQLDQTFKILSYNGSAYFQPRNKKVLEKINDLPSLTNWFNPTDWTKIIKSTINYTDSVYEKERFSTHIDKSGKRNPKKNLSKLFRRRLKSLLDYVIHGFIFNGWSSQWETFMKIFETVTGYKWI